jgi:hypothetical protein
MEVGQGPNWGCSAKEKKHFISQNVFRSSISVELKGLMKIIFKLILVSTHFRRYV